MKPLIPHRWRLQPLFCNVFRIGTWMEPPRHLTFVATSVYGFAQPWFLRLLLLTVCEALEWALIGYRIRQDPYVGTLQRHLARFSSES